MDGPRAMSAVQLIDDLPGDGRDRIRRADTFRREQPLVEEIVQQTDRGATDLLIGVERQNLSRVAISKNSPRRVVAMDHVRPLALDEAPDQTLVERHIGHEASQAGAAIVIVPMKLDVRRKRADLAVRGKIVSGIEAENDVYWIGA